MLLFFHHTAGQGFRMHARRWPTSSQLAQREEEAAVERGREKKAQKADERDVQWECKKPVEWVEEDDKNIWIFPVRKSL